MSQFVPDDNPPDDLISLYEAEELGFGSRRSLFRALRAEKLRKYKRTGDRKVYISLAELTSLSGFKEVRAKYG